MREDYSRNLAAARPDPMFHARATRRRHRTRLSPRVQGRRTWATSPSRRSTSTAAPPAPSHSSRCSKPTGRAGTSSASRLVACVTCAPDRRLHLHRSRSISTGIAFHARCVDEQTRSSLWRSSTKTLAAREAHDDAINRRGGSMSTRPACRFAERTATPPSRFAVQRAHRSVSRRRLVRLSKAAVALKWLPLAGENGSRVGRRQTPARFLAMLRPCRRDWFVKRMDVAAAVGGGSVAWWWSRCLARCSGRPRGRGGELRWRSACDAVVRVPYGGWRGGVSSQRACEPQRARRSVGIGGDA